MNWLSVFDHFVGLALKGLSVVRSENKSLAAKVLWLNKVSKETKVTEIYDQKE